MHHTYTHKYTYIHTHTHTHTHIHNPQEIELVISRAQSAESELRNQEIERDKMREDMRTELARIQSDLAQRVTGELEAEKKGAREARVRALQAEKDAREASCTVEQLQDELDR